MNCQQCGLSLDPQQVAQTGHCPRCDAAVAVQQPVAANAYPQQPGTYTPVSAQPGYGVPPAPGMYPQGYPGGVTPPPQKNKTGLIAVISVVVVVVLVAGSLLALGLGGKGPLSSLGGNNSTNGTNTSAATATPGIPSGFEVYTSNGHLYSVAVPSDWQQSVDDEDQEQVEFDGPAGQVAITDDFTPDSSVTPESYTSIICTLLSGGSSDTAQPTQVTIGGQSWTRMECDSSDGSAHVVVEAASYNGNIASLLFTSDPSSFAQDQAQFYSVMERTFTFLN